MEFESSTKAILFDKISFWSFVATVALLPIFFIPMFPLSMEVGKTLLLAFGVVVSFVTYLIARLQEGSFTYPKTIIFLGVGGLVLTSGLSALFSSASLISFVGLAFDKGTFVHTLLLCMMLVLGALIAGKVAQATKLYKYLIVGACAVGVFQVASLLLQKFGVGQSFFGSPLASILGSWNDLGIYFGLITIVSVFALELAHIRARAKMIASITLGLSLFMMIVVNVPLVWVVTGFISLLVFIYTLVANRAHPGESTSKSATIFPAISFGIVLVSLLFVLANPLVGNIAPRFFNTGHTDVRPSFIATMQVAGKSIRHDPVFGLGNNRFSEVWGKFHPTNLNESQFWNASFNEGFGYVPTLIATSGILVGLAILFLIASVVWIGVRKVFIFSGDARENILLTGTFISVIYLWIFAIVYTPGTVILVFTFATTGILVGLLTTYGCIPSVSFTYLTDPRKSFFSIFTIVILMLGTIAGGYMIIERAIAVSYLGRAVTAFNHNDTDKAGIRVSRSLALAQSQEGYRVLSQTALAKLGTILNAKGISQEVIGQQFQSIFQTAQASGQSLIALNKENPSSWIAFGDLYRQLVPLQIKGAYDSGKQAYVQAKTLTPNDPSIALALARLEIANKDTGSARTYIKEALALKRNYTEAVFVLASIDASEGNLKSAIDQVQSASILDPNNSTLFFQLGLLKFNNKDYDGAKGAFERSILLDPTYLNSRYFLGVTASKRGDMETAIAIFENLHKALPNNTEIAQVLTNLKNGKSALDGIVQDGNTQTLPITETQAPEQVAPIAPKTTPKKP